MKQLELSFWNDPKTIDKKAQDLKQIKLERRNEWIKKNLKNYNHEFDHPNINGLKY